MVFVHEMVACSERDQMRVVSRGWNGDGAGAANIGVAKLVGENLQVVSYKAVVVPQHMVMRRSRSALKSNRSVNFSVRHKPIL